MADGLRMAAAFAVALLGTWLAVPLAVRLASRTAFYDRPGGYKEHRQPTPYLGGAAVIAGFLAAAAIFADGLSGLRLAALCALALLAVGTLDDRVNLGISARLAVEVGVAVALFASDEGWQVASADWVNLAITILWVVGLINAFNLMDNLDGAASTVAAVSAAGTGALALVESDAILAAVCLSLAGACAGFLPSNLARPSKIFLGDGGSMPIGFILAAATMALPHDASGGLAVAVSALLVGLPLLDTAMVVLSRLHRGVSPFRGGRDHMTHRLVKQLGSERHVAAALAVTQGIMCAAAIALHGSGSPTVVLGSETLMLIAVVAALASVEPLSRLGHRIRRAISPARPTRPVG